jgi:hypothetical protein
MIVIGVDPHKSTHTATALDPATNTDVGSLRIEASLAEYQRLIARAMPWPERTWAIENADGLGHHLALWLLARGEVVSTFRRPRPRGSGNSHAAVAAKTTASTPPQQPVSLRCRAMGVRSTRKPPRTRWRSSTSVESTCPTVEPVLSTSCTRCCGS